MLAATVADNQSTSEASRFPELTVSTNTSQLADQIIDIAVGERAPEPTADRRIAKRVPYRDYVALLLISPTGDRGRPIVLRARNISVYGISVISRHMIYPGSVGAMQLLRTDGRLALVGIRVKISRYIGNMEHHTGMSFMPLPHGVTTEEFLDRHGRIVLMDPLLRDNLDDKT
jgi:hypothetical protein